MVQQIGFYELIICGEAGIVDVVDVVTGDPVPRVFSSAWSRVSARWRWRRRR